MLNGKNFLAKHFSWGAVFITAIFIIIVFILGSRIWGEKDPTAFFEAPAPYKADSKYFVYLFPSTSSSMNYRLPADLIIEKDCYGAGECDNSIQIEDVYFDNGETKYFGCTIQMKTENFCEDQDGKEWMIVMSDWEKSKTIQEIQDSKKRIDDLVESVMDESN